MYVGRKFSRWYTLDDGRRQKFFGSVTEIEDGKLRLVYENGDFDTLREEDFLTVVK